MILVIDNYDSFTWNLVHLMGGLGEEIVVRRNDALTAEDALSMNARAVVLSPGPKTPDDAGICLDLIRLAARRRAPVFGVCLGLQAIAQAFGGKIVRAPALMHGKTSRIEHDGSGIFAGLPSSFTATRYHSLLILPDTFDHDRFEMSAWTDEKEIMAMRARPGIFGAGNDAPLEGVQFHPESFLTTEGPVLLANFLGLPRPVVQEVKA